MLISKNETVTTSKQKLKKPKQYTNTTEKTMIVTNLRLAVKYYGKDYLRRIFKITKGRVLHGYIRH